MSLRKLPWRSALVGLVVVVGLPLAGHRARRGTPTGCALDGQRFDASYRVAVVDAGGERHEFCCLVCAELWLARRSEPPRAVTVTDEESGQEVDAGEASYVRSWVVTNPATGNRVHVFRSREAAEEHAEAFGGTVLSGSERPFRPGAAGARP